MVIDLWQKLCVKLSTTNIPKEVIICFLYYTTFNTYKLCEYVAYVSFYPFQKISDTCQSTVDITLETKLVKSILDITNVVSQRMTKHPQ